MRNVLFTYDDSASFAHALRQGEQELPLPPGETAADGEWVLAIFEVGRKRRATAAAARGLHRGPAVPVVLAFERRDWERLIDFAEASSARTVPAAREAVPFEPPTEPCLVEFDPPSSPDLGDPRGAPSASPERDDDAPPGAPALMQGADARVLLVDDDRDICDVVGAMLDAVGLRVEAARSAEEALDRIRAASYDLLVLDWNLPGMTGVELCRAIRSEPTLSTLPVLFLTAHAASRDVVEAFASGADDYVAKPFRAPELGARIFGLLRRARMTAASA